MTANRGGSESLADVLERVLDKGVVVAGDIVVNLVDVELLALKVRLLICSIDTAQKIGIDWWRSDPFLSSEAARDGAQKDENRELRERLDRIEALLRPDGKESPNGG
ncbi:MAG: gas vesicle protein [Candidatus Dormibacteraeota bacterium]|nr:gas vesicle protein [Candidatus Dormibacteraeota bacterium]